MREIPEIKKDMTALEAKAKHLKGSRIKTVETIEAAKAVRPDVSLQALTAGDTKAQQKLKQAHNDQREAELTLEDIDAALSEVTRKLTELQAEHKQAEDHAKRQRRNVIGEKLKDQARFLDGTAMSHAQLLTEHAATLREYIGITSDLGEPTGNVGLKHFRRFWEASLHAVFPFEYSKQPEIYRSTDYETFLTKQLDAIGNRGAEPQIDAAEKVAS